MSGADVGRADRVDRALRLPAGRDAAAGALLDDGRRLDRDRALRGDHHRADAAAGRLHGARLPLRAGLARPRRSARSSAARTACCGSTRSAARSGRPTPSSTLVFSALFWLPALPDPAHAGHPSVQPAGPQGRYLRRVVQHDVVVHHEHELAVLRRRDDDVVLLADGRPGRAELRLGRRGHGRRRRADPRDRLALGPASSATSTSTSPGRLLYVLVPISIVVGLVLVSQGVLQNLSGYLDLHTLTGGDQTLGLGPVGLAGGHQGARHERRRLLQRQLDDAVREPDVDLELRRDALRSSPSRPA